MIQRVLLSTVCLALVATGIALNWHSFSGREPARLVDFNRDIRPILNQNCTSCHGGVKQAGNVSFIYREEALGKGKSGRPTVVPGRPNASELMARVTSRDPNVRMPLHGQPLSTQQIDLLKQWIEEGAQWQDYWAFVPPKPQALPPVKQKEWVRQPLDSFILARLEKEGLPPSPQADKAALLRRVSFDLIGLPPTPEEVAVFLADASPDAYEKQVDRLLASPHYGERWAAMWLDLARYADSQGYDGVLESPRSGMWQYRDWVVDAFNNNMQYDRFIIKQLAGDLLPDASVEDQIASAFNRNTPSNNEGGTDDEEYRILAAMDRVSTTWSVLNGVTMNCVQCHSHPYDPIRHGDYYKSLAFFNNTLDWDAIDDFPTLRVAKDRKNNAAVLKIQKEIESVIRSATEHNHKLAQPETQWRILPISYAALDEDAASKFSTSRIRSGFLPDENRIRIDAQYDGDKEKLHQKAAEALRDFFSDNPKNNVVHKSVNPKVLLKGGEALLADENMPVAAVFELTAPAHGDISAIQIQVPPMNPASAIHTPETGFIVDQIDALSVSAGGTEQKLAIKYYAGDIEQSVSRTLLPDHHVLGRYSEIEFSAFPKLMQTRWMVLIPEKTIKLDPGGKIKIKLMQTQLISNKAAIIRRIRLRASNDPKWTRFVEGSYIDAARTRLTRLQSQLDSIPTEPIPVMVERPGYARRATLQFDRGNFLAKVGSALEPGTPHLFPDFPPGGGRDRLSFAKWFFSPQQPLTARVAVNRYWEQLFGTGIVETLEDFGSSGQPPSHPELLDWLALHFQNDLHWNVKALLREIVISAAYRQSARAQSALLTQDPQNRLLARGPQQRLTAEMVRDQALMASNLLNFEMGGPSVYPPLPDGVAPSVGLQWVNSNGKNRYRRAVYTAKLRNAMYPSFLIFDGSVHDVSLARRLTSNTPLQALVTLNDPVYSEAARFLADRMLRMNVEVPPNTAPSPAVDRVDTSLVYGARLVLSRNPSPRELAALKKLYGNALRPEKGIAQSKMASLNRQKWAFTAVASALLNSDAALMR